MIQKEQMFGNKKKYYQINHHEDLVISGKSPRGYKHTSERSNMYML